MVFKESSELIPNKLITQKILQIRGKHVILDKDLAVLYNVETKQIKRAVRRNTSRFPIDFMFELNLNELENLRSQNGTSSWGGSRYIPMVFTEHGILMLSSVLNSDRAVQVNIQIIRVFTKMRELLSSHKNILQKLEQLENKDIEQDEKIVLIFKYLKQLEKVKQEGLKYKNRRRMGYKTSK